MSDRLRASTATADLYRSRQALSDEVRARQAAEARVTELLIEIDRLRAEIENLKSRRYAA